ncbi:MAG: hypothetical protein K2W96_13380 [Gemmataceae bacterium]|nr:hypothetical protein [Gemmataceae bacterium]
MLFLLALADEPMKPKLPKPFETPSVVKHPKAVGWPEGRMPKAPVGFKVSLFSKEVESPR